MKNIVFFIDSYKVNASANGVCCENIINDLSKDNNIIIISEKKSKDDKSYEKISDNISLYKVWRGFDSIFRYKYNRIFISKIIAKLYYLMFFFRWPLHNPLLIYRNIKLFNKISKRTSVDLVIGVFQTLENSYSACVLKNKHPNLKFYLYTLDSIAGGFVLRVSKHKKYFFKSMEKWEKKLFFSADKIIAMESHRSHYENNQEKYIDYNDKIEFADIPLFYVRNNFHKQKNSMKKIVYTGTLNDSYTDLAFLDKTIKDLALYEFNFYGKIDDKANKMIMNNENAVYGGYLNKRQVEEVQNQADFLLNFGSNVPCMISGKIFDYFSSGRPIIHLYNSDLDPALLYLRQYKNSILIDEREDYNEIIVKINQFLSQSFDCSDTKELEKTFYKNNPKYTSDLINDIMGE